MQNPIFVEVIYTLDYWFEDKFDIIWTQGDSIVINNLR